jgi:uncharacterized oligopeptide transporter (OPT) family protein
LPVEIVETVTAKESAMSATEIVPGGEEKDHREIVDIPASVRTEARPCRPAPDDYRRWLEEVYQGDAVPQLTIRAVAMGVFLGGIFSLSNLYLGFKMGFGMGAGITSCILAFALFKFLRTVAPRRFGSEFTILENNTMQSAATAAAYIPSAGLISAVPALMIITGEPLSFWKLAAWTVSVCSLGLFMAVPMKRQFINEEKLRFPTAIAAAETLKSMHLKGGEAMKKAKTLSLSALLGGAVAWLRDGPAKWMPFNIPPTWGPSFSILGIPSARLTLAFDGGLIMMAGGAIMGLRIGASIVLGALLNYACIAPVLINKGVIRHSPTGLVSYEKLRFPLTIEPGAALTLVLLEQGQPENRLSYAWKEGATYPDPASLISALNAPTLPGDGGKNPFYGVLTFSSDGGTLHVRAPAAVSLDATLSVPPDSGGARDAAPILRFKPGQTNTVRSGGYRNILKWSMWPGTALLVSSGLLAFALRWRTIARAFSGLKGLFAKSGRSETRDRPTSVEIPISWFLKGFIAAGLACIVLQWCFFGISIGLALLAVPLSFLLAIVACRAMGETDSNPIGSLSKITQLSYGVISPQNVPCNLMTANVTAGTATASADLLMNLKSGYILGGNPRKQLIAQLVGIGAGSVLSAGAFLLLVPNAAAIGTESLPAPAAQVWAGVANLLSKGVSALPPFAPLGLLFGALAGGAIALIEVKRPKTRRFLPSPLAIGIGFVIPAFAGISIFAGALAAWIFGRVSRKLSERYTLPAASGIIAGESLIGILIMTAHALKVF